MSSDNGAAAVSAVAALCSSIGRSRIYSLGTSSLDMSANSIFVSLQPRPKFFDDLLAYFRGSQRSHAVALFVVVHA